MSTKRRQLTRLTDEQVLCRGPFRHAWDEFRPRQGEFTGKSLRQRPKPDLCMRCERCQTKKFLWLDEYGEYAYTPRYVYPSGYVLDGLYRGDRLTAAELRVETVRRRRVKRPAKRSSRLRRVA